VRRETPGDAGEYSPYLVERIGPTPESLRAPEGSVTRYEYLQRVKEKHDPTLRHERRASHRKIAFAGSGISAVLVVLAIFGAAGWLEEQSWVRNDVAISFRGEESTKTRWNPGSADIDAIEDFWEDEYPKTFGKKYTPLPEKRIVDLRSTQLVASCGGEVFDGSGNAFYCPPDDTIGYDPSIFSIAGADSGAVRLLVLAHEYGHRVHHMSGTSPRDGLEAELQADCFAGATTRYIASKGTSAEEDAALRAALLSMVQFSEGATYDVTMENAHGSAFDRAMAVRRGWNAGASSCTTLTRKETRIVEGAIFTEGSGDVALSEVPQMTISIVSAVFGGPELRVTAGSCSENDIAAVCDGVLRYDAELMAQLYSSFGDFAASVPLINAYTSHLAKTGRADMKEADEICLVGAVAKRMYEAYVTDDRSFPFALAGTDLDEIVSLIAVLSDGAQDAYYMLDALGRGFQGGVASCK
jgi:predicted metalloprotease